MTVGAPPASGIVAELFARRTTVPALELVQNRLSASNAMLVGCPCSDAEVMGGSQFGGPSCPTPSPTVHAPTLPAVASSAQRTNGWSTATASTPWRAGMNKPKLPK